MVKTGGLCGNRKEIAGDDWEKKEKKRKEKRKKLWKEEEKSVKCVKGVRKYSGIDEIQDKGNTLKCEINGKYSLGYLFGLGHRKGI